MTYSSDSDQTRTLLEKVAEGNTFALDRLLELHRPFLLRLITLRLDPQMRSRVDPSDIVQETQIVISKRIEDFLERRPTSFRIWARRKALERLIEQRRRHIGAERRSTRREKQMANSSIAIARKLLTDTPSKILRKNEMQDRVRNLIAELGDNDREILTLRHIEGLTNAEVADLLRMKPNTVRQKYGRALRRLHERLTANGISLGGLS